MQNGGYYPHLEAIARIADYLDVSVDYLLGRTNTSTEDINMKLYNRIKILPDHTKEWLMDTLDRLEGKK
jgi:transcriptional regulator with XRE-family HTH domain